jgi:ubiquinone/menaquinone biosynthesis C-methylase UbiE
MNIITRAVRASVGPAMAAASRLPSMRRIAWRAIYNLAAAPAAGDLAELDFFNWGYQPLDHDVPRLELDPRHERFRESIQLYHHIAGQVDLEGTDVLEVGCGRGGGAAWVKQHHRARTLVGVDLAENNVAVCNKRHGGVAGLSFEQGDAQELPFDAATFDAVLNVESSHCYPDRLGFFREVARILRPGGHFLYGDIINSHALGRFRYDLAHSGLVLRRLEDITLNVMRSRQTICAAANEFTGNVGSALRAQIFNWAAVEGSDNYRKLEEGHSTYVCVLGRKDAKSR